MYLHRRQGAERRGEEGEVAVRGAMPGMPNPEANPEARPGAAELRCCPFRHARARTRVGREAALAWRVTSATPCPPSAPSPCCCKAAAAAAAATAGEGEGELGCGSDACQ